jgi:hypothetical protein
MLVVIVKGAVMHMLLMPWARPSVLSDMQMNFSIMKQQHIPNSPITILASERQIHRN